MKLSDPAPVTCPACEKPGLKKQVSAAAFRLKGSGWYETDFKTGSKKNISQGAGGSSDSGGGDSGSSSSSGGDKASTAIKSSESSSSKSAAPKAS
jgi:predicted nucleic acid-binding Zn ribbon protein